jgi:hypothetical protein
MTVSTEIPKAARRKAIPDDAWKLPFEARAGLVNDEREQVLKHLFLARLMTRSQLAATVDPVAFFRWDAIPEQDHARYLSVIPTPEEAETRRKAARKLSDRLVRELNRLGFITVEHQLVNPGSPKDRALRSASFELPLGKNGRRADVVHLSEDGLIWVKSHYGIDDKEPPVYKHLARRPTHVPHSLAIAQVYVGLLMMERLEQIEIVEFNAEYSWGPALVAANDKGGVIPRSDIRVVLAPYGDELAASPAAMEICIEIDRATQTAARNAAPGQKRTHLLRPKFDEYLTLPDRLGRKKADRSLWLVFLVPDHALTKPETRQQTLQRVYKEQLAALNARGKESLLKVIHQMQRPTPEIFAIRVAHVINSVAGDADAGAEGL